jgi:L-cysteine/cystine lyase
MRVQELRESLPLTQTCIYMNTGQAGPTPKAVLKQIGETLRQEAVEGPGSIKQLRLAQMIEERARISVANLINVDPDDVRITHNSREGIYAVLYGLHWQKGDELLTCDLEHSSISKPAAVLAERFGVKVVKTCIPPLASQEDVIRIIQAALTSKTRLVALSHIQYGCGLRMPIKAIARAVHEKDSLLLVDGAQSVGHILVDVAELECDFYACSGQKWLLGPVGTGALYIRRSRRDLLEPLFTTNLIEGGRDPQRSHLARFAIAPINSGLLAGMTEAVRLSREIGIKLIEDRVTMLAGTLYEGLASILGTTMISQLPSALGSGLVTVTLETCTPDSLVERLQTQFRIIARAVHAPEGVRFCTAYFNTEQEVEWVVAAIKQCAKKIHEVP